MTVPKFATSKGRATKLSVLTAYDFLWAGLFDEAGVDAILVGDSLGMVVQGRSSTLPVTLDQMIYHGEMVARAVKRALVIVDLPFMSYQVSPTQALENAGRVLKETGASAVKLEGGVNQAETIRALASADLPVMAHVGMRPQSVRKLGAMSKVQRDETQLLADARAAEDAGAFAIVLELIPRGIAAKITEALSIPTIGIGAGPDCDGQVLVSCDMLGLTDGFQPKFLKRYADLRSTAINAVQQFVSEVGDGSFPDSAHSHD
jgi:3-methyl-2-oxobutanoate hydroxymethyltransferase